MYQYKNTDWVPCRDHGPSISHLEQFKEWQRGEDAKRGAQTLHLVFGVTEGVATWRGCHEGLASPPSQTWSEGGHRNVEGVSRR